jgi:hypothetical protein
MPADDRWDLIRRLKANKTGTLPGEHNPHDRLSQRSVLRNDRPSECRYTDGFIPIRRNLSRKVKTILLKLEMMKRRKSEHPGSRTFRTVALDIWEEAPCSSSHRTMKKVIQTTRSKREQCTAKPTALYRAQEEYNTASAQSEAGLCHTFVCCRSTIYGCF